MQAASTDRSSSAARDLIVTGLVPAGQDQIPRCIRAPIAACGLHTSSDRCLRLERFWSLARQDRERDSRPVADLWRSVRQIGRRFAWCVDEIVAEELDGSSVIREVIAALAKARTALLDRIKDLDRLSLASAKASSTARLFTTAPGVGPITALSVASVFDDASRFRCSPAGLVTLRCEDSDPEDGAPSRIAPTNRRGLGLQNMVFGWDRAVTLALFACKPVDT